MYYYNRYILRIICFDFKRKFYNVFLYSFKYVFDTLNVIQRRMYLNVSLIRKKVS